MPPYIMKNYDNIVHRCVDDVFISDIDPARDACKQTSTCMSNSKRKSLRFADLATVIKIIHINDMTPREIQKAWFTTPERAEIKKQIWATIRQMEVNENQVEEPGECSRGLERYTKENLDRRTEIRALVYDAVFSMQELHEHTGKWHPEALAKFCQRRSAQSRKDAHEIALIDAKEAR